MSENHRVRQSIVSGYVCVVEFASLLSGAQIAAVVLNFNDHLDRPALTGTDRPDFG